MAHCKYARLKLAESTQAYPNIHWSNRIHIDDLAGFLAHLLHVAHSEPAYIWEQQPS